MKRATDWKHMPYEDGPTTGQTSGHYVAWYCERCGGRNVFGDARVDLNTGESYECGDGLTCDDCDDDDATTTEHRHEAAHARYNWRRQELDGCTCGADYLPGKEPDHAKHCKARPPIPAPADAMAALAGGA